MLKSKTENTKWQRDIKRKIRRQKAKMRSDPLKGFIFDF